MLDDMGHTFTLKSIRFMAYLLRKVFRNIYAGIKVNMEGLNQVFCSTFVYAHFYLINEQLICGNY